MNIIGFPGLGIKDFELNPIAFEIFGVKIAWYGIIITAGIILAVAYAYMRGKQSKLIFDDILDIAFGTVIPGIVGARAYYVFFDWLKNPDNYESFYDVINIRGGGLAIYGGIIFGAIGCIVTLKIKKINILKFFDCMAPGVMIAQALGRWGNFFNAEAYGAETTLPWRMRITYATYNIEVHPTFLYESLWNVIGFTLINLVFWKKRKYDGQILLMYISWYGFGRMLIEGLRQDSLYIGNTGIRVSQLLAFFCFVIGLAVLIFFAAISNTHGVGDCIYLKSNKKYAVVMGESDNTDKVPAKSEENTAENNENPKENNNEQDN